MSIKSKKPFHLAIVDVLKECASSDFVGLANIINNTVIPANHDEIIKVWKERIKIFEYNIDFGVPESVEAQKRACLQKV